MLDYTALLYNIIGNRIRARRRKLGLKQDGLYERQKSIHQHFQGLKQARLSKGEIHTSLTVIIYP